MYPGAVTQPIETTVAVKCLRESVMVTPRRETTDNPFCPTTYTVPYDMFHHTHRRLKVRIFFPTRISNIICAIYFCYSNLLSNYGLTDTKAFSNLRYFFFSLLRNISLRIFFFGEHIFFDYDVKVK